MCSHGTEEDCVHTVVMSNLQQREKLQPVHGSCGGSWNVAVDGCGENWNRCSCCSAADVSKLLRWMQCADCCRVIMIMASDIVDFFFFLKQGSCLLNGDQCIAVAFSLLKLML